MKTPAFAVSGAVPSSLDDLDLTAAPEFRAFLDTIDARGPTGLQVPLILENALRPSTRPGWAATGCAAARASTCPLRRLPPCG